MREVPFHQVTNGSWEAILAEADRGSWCSVGITVFDPAGRRSTTGKLEPNGCIVIESGYVEEILYMLGTGEVVRLVDEGDPLANTLLSEVTP